jgi:hypothetical protein
MSYFVLWPHAKPWRMGHVEPMLRCIPNAQAVGQILGRALADHAGNHAPSAASVSRVPVNAFA